MDRERSRETLQNININKVADKIGLEEQVKYNSIDVYVDNHNPNNLWAIAHYSVARRNRNVSQDKIMKFHNYTEMQDFIRSNFDTYELSHYVDYINRKIFIHKVDYVGMDYYLYEGNPDANYIVVRYKEYTPNGTRVREEELPKEYEQMLLEIIKTNKQNDPMFKIDSDFYREINVNEKGEPFTDEEGRERVSRKARRIEKEKNQIPMPEEKSRKWFTKPVIYVSLIALLATGGIILVKTSEYKKEFITQEKPDTFSIADFYIGHDQDKALLLINDLMINNYDGISEEDLSFLFNYIKSVSSSNYDKNKSGTYFNYKEFFSPILWKNKSSVEEAVKIDEIISKIEEIYHDCFKVVDNRLMLKENSVKKYIDYVGSLTVMYDTVVDQRNSGQAQIDIKYMGMYASKNEIEAYNKLPKIVKYVILNQLQDMIYHSDYQITVHPANYRNGKEIDKFDLLNDVRTKISVLEEIMKTESRLANEKTV